MATNVSDGDLRKLVAKDSDDRVRREIKLAQPHLDPTEVDQMGREDMVSLVTKLRKLAGVTTTLKDPVLHAATLELPVRPSSASRIDPMEAMMQMIAMMKAERDAQAVRDERLAQVAQEKEARLAAERAEERALEVRKLAQLEHERLMALIRQQNEELIIADKLKDSLPYAARDYVRAREGAEVYDSQRVAQLADLYINDHPNVERNIQHSNKSFSRNQFRPKNFEARQTRSASPQKDRPRFSSSHGRGQNSSQGKQFENRGTVQAGVRPITRALLDSGKKQDLGSGGFRSSSTIRCWTCDEVGHSRNQCPRNRSSGQTGIKQIHEISLRAESAVDELSRSPVTGPRPICSDREPVDTHGVYRLALTGEEGTAIGDQSRNGEPPFKVFLPVSNCLELDLMGGVVSGLLDTGAMISVLSPAV